MIRSSKSYLLVIQKGDREFTGGIWGGEHLHFTAQPNYKKLPIQADFISAINSAEAPLIYSST